MSAPTDRASHGTDMSASGNGKTEVRRLSELPAALSGGLPQNRIEKLLADLAVELTPLHNAGTLHGAICPANIGLDRTGRAQLLAPPLGAQANAANAVLAPGYAAFEQYTDDPDTPCGPWTDLYALSALAHLLITGQAPADARTRCIHDEAAPLLFTAPEGYDPAFLTVLDRNLSLHPQ